MRILKFTIPGPPQQKRSGTPMATRPKDGSHPRVFFASNAKNKPVERNIQQYAIQAGWEGPPHDGPVELTVKAYFPFLKSWSKKKAAEAEGKHHIKKPDRDRLENMVMDALEGMCWINDSQISGGDGSKKRYSVEPRTEIEIKFIEQEWRG